MKNLFFTSAITDGLAYLDEEESRHLTTVLRHQPGDTIKLTDGKGSFYEGEIAEIGKKQVLVTLTATVTAPHTLKSTLHLAISPTKQMERIEWLMEKATEVGLGQLTLLHCKRSERTSARIDRLEKIALSAMKQSMRPWLPVVHAITPFDQFIKQARAEQKFIGWCPDEPPAHLRSIFQPGKSAIIMIGPPGDFTPEEVDQAVQEGFSPINLGAVRLRTETAGLLSVCIANLAEVPG